MKTCCSLWRPLALSISLGLSACANSPVSLDPSRSALIHKIAIVGPEEPRQYFAMDGNLPIAMGVGAGIGGVVGGSITASTLESAIKAGDFDAEMKALDPKFAKDFRIGLTQALDKSGYAITEQILTHPFGEWPTYAAVDNSADAVLDASIVFIYETEMFSSVYTPTAILSARLTDRTTGKTLFQNLYVYGKKSPTFPFDASHSFASRQDLINNPRRAAEYFQASVPILAEALARDLRK